tara:strand:- start:224 stop:1522 length:1299 start_codon:yes stop_codon:yes gene_type:complete
MLNEYLIKDLVSDVIDNRGKSPEYHHEITEYPIIEVNSIRGDRAFPVEDKFNKFVSKEVYENWFRSGHPQRNDVLISTVGSGNIGEVALFNGKGCIAQNLIALRFNKELCNQEFIYYLFSSKRYKSLLVNLDIGSAQPSIKVPHILNSTIYIPDLRHQELTANLLTRLDKKIELNQKMNQTLEEVAKTLFKSWFIDFDPVRAKAEGKPTGLSKEISDLFPDSFEDSELGEIPMGWSKSVITDIAYKISDKYKKDEDWSNEKLIDLSRMPSNSISLNSYGRGDELSTSVCKFKKYDFLFGSIRPYFYKAGICPYDGVSNTSVFILRAKKTYDREFIYCYSSSEVTFEKSVQYSDGTKMPIIKWKDFKEFQFAMPNEDIRKHFSSIINPIVEKIICNIEGQEILSKLRDTLLPKLISGELKIPDAENLIKEAGN